jgi:FkbM family methyltransferase
MTTGLTRLRLACLLRPILGRVPRGYGKAYGYLLGREGSSYLADPYFKQNLERRHRIFYDRHIGCYVLADLGDATSRNHYVLGRYYENFIPLLIRRLLEPGDTFIDIGANRGVHTMFAARYLRDGRVISFEPHPPTFRILQAHVTINHLGNCELHNIGLSDEEGTLELRLFADDAPSGCSFIDKGYGRVQRTFAVPIRRLEDVLGGEPPKTNTLIKVDTEGFDHRVTRGMGRLLESDRLAIVTEVMDDWLRKAGSSAHAFFEDLVGRGFRAFLPRVGFRGFTERLILEPLSQVPQKSDQYDLVFAKPGILAGGRRAVAAETVSAS